jgi:ABC-type dipeptide/oligopeptide/nickel transport system permease component
MQAVVLTMTAIFMVANLLVDIAYVWLDPRVRA